MDLEALEHLLRDLYNLQEVIDENNYEAEQLLSSIITEIELEIELKNRKTLDI